MLGEPEFRASAGRIKQEIEDMRPPADVVAMIEDPAYAPDAESATVLRGWRIEVTLLPLNRQLRDRICVAAS